VPFVAISPNCTDTVWPYNEDGAEPQEQREERPALAGAGKSIPEHGAPLTPEWECLRAEVSDGVARSRLSSLMRFCSANGIPPADRVRLEFPLEDYLTRLIDEYVHDFRPALVRGRNENWLFPGQRKGAKGKVSFSGQITKRIYKVTGMRITVHQFRHAAAAIILQRRPGEYELVRRILGHRNVQTTINSYWRIFRRARSSERSCLSICIWTSWSRRNDQGPSLR
jgi:integrase